ncbi:MAG: LysR family transcriptional regulator substrate-binding protein [Synergistaceae bacterium]|nr:LysR family transcriptional regulator substrate-binding protein [Synergistaceae bacterium]
MTGRLRIGTSRDRASFMMPKMFPAFCEKYPGIKVEVFTQSGQKLREALKEGRIDILLLPDIWLEGEQGFMSRLIYTEELVLVAKAGSIPDEYCTPDRRAIIPDALNNLKLFLLFREHAIRMFCDRYSRSVMSL